MKVTVNASVHAYKTERWDDESGQWAPEFRYQVFPFKMESTDRIFVCEQEIFVEIPDDFDYRKGAISVLEDQKKKIAAEYQKRVTELNAQIQSLLAIEA
jgi:hypothetical protein